MRQIVLLASVVLVLNPWYVTTMTRAESPASPSPMPSASPSNLSPHPTDRPGAQSKPPEAPKLPATKEVSQFRRIEFRRPEAKLPAIASPGSPITPPSGAGSQPTGPKPPILLVPSTERELTIASHPTLFAYIPQAGWVEFGLTEAKTAGAIYTTKFVVQAPGIVQITVPKSVPPLAIGKTYRWYVSVVNDPKQPQEASSVQGQLQRVEPSTNLRQQLAHAVPGELPAIYAEAGLWYETLTTLAELRSVYPQDGRLAAAWRDLLMQNGLNAVASADLIEGSMPPGNPPSPSAAPLKSPEPASGDATRVREMRQPEVKLPGRREYRPPSKQIPGRRDGGGLR